jgi:hypothetical protein
MKARSTGLGGSSDWLAGGGGESYRFLSERVLAAKMKVMVGAALVFGALVVAISVYGIRAGDHELILKVWSFVMAGGLVVLVWAAGSVREVLRRMKLDDDEGDRRCDGSGVGGTTRRRDFNGEIRQ